MARHSARMTGDVDDLVAGLATRMNTTASTGLTGSNRCTVGVMMERVVACELDPDRLDAGNPRLRALRRRGDGPRKPRVVRGAHRTHLREATDPATAERFTGGPLGAARSPPTPTDLTDRQHEALPALGARRRGGRARLPAHRRPPRDLR